MLKLIIFNTLFDDGKDNTESIDALESTVVGVDLIQTKK